MNDPAIHPLAWAQILASRNAMLVVARTGAESVEARRAAVDSLRACVAWAQEGLPLLAGESHGSVPASVIAPLRAALLLLEAADEMAGGGNDAS